MIELRVDGDPKAVSYNSRSQPQCDSKPYYHPIRISALLSLKFGQMVGVYVTEGKIYECPPACTTRFSAILFTPK